MNLESYDVSKFSPMMQQYLEIKKDYTDAIVFFRLGDFYEMFFEDAIVASKELELQLTGKDCGQDKRVPMCGIPFHAYEIYALKLIEKGYKIAIVEQVEDPKEAKGIVKRDVIRILTPGTCVIGELREKENKFLAAIIENNKNYILAYTDILTGKIYLTNLKDKDEVINELENIDAKEVLVESRFNKKFVEILKSNYNYVISYFDKKDIPSYLGALINELEDKKEIEAVGLLINYILKTQRENVSHLQNVIKYQYKQYLKIDYHSKRNLELTETIRFNQKNGSLLHLLDKTETAMGSRMLARWINYPLVDEKEIVKRQDYIEAFINDQITLMEVKERLKGVYDLERIIGKISFSTVNAKDLSQLRKTLENIASLKDYLHSSSNQLLANLSATIDENQELIKLLKDAIKENPSYLLREGNLINPSYNETLKELHEIRDNSHLWLKNYEEAEKEKSGIKNLKIGYNKVFGYYIEITKSNLQDGYLENYERKQTLVNAERFITPELKDFEVKVLSANDKIVELEYEIFNEVKNVVATHTQSLQKLANIISNIDCYLALAIDAINYNFVRPTFNHQNEITIVDGRHPVLAQILKGDYVDNDVYVNKYNLLLITGPNMSGKSTYMKMVALIIIMGQMGSFVPAKKACLPLIDQIFTRIGASDDLNSGQSTFMIEMVEANNALKGATKDSLILFDELGRGTATYDGLALAQAIIEYIHEKIGATTLFSTHYHELIGLEKTLNRLKNIHVEAMKENGKVIFLHKVKDGPINKSYGINVAELAHLPKALIERSKMILESLEADSQKNIEFDLFNFDSEKEEIEPQNNYQEIIDELSEIDINTLSPIEAFNTILELKKKL